MKFLFLIFLTAFILNKSDAQKAKVIPRTKTMATNPCIYCGGTGSGLRTPLICMNCLNWSAEYRRKVPCHVCKDTRVVYNKKCTFCEGTGRLKKDYFKFSVNSTSPDKKNSKQDLISDIPQLSDQPMSDKETQKVINEYTNPALKQLGSNPISTSIMSEYPSRPIEKPVEYKNEFADEQSGPMTKEEEEARYQKFIETEKRLGLTPEETVREMVKEQKLKNLETKRIRRYGDSNANVVADSLFKRIAIPLVEKVPAYSNVLQKAANGMASPEIRSLIKDVSITWKGNVKNASFEVHEKVIINSSYLSETIMDGNVIEKKLFKNGKYQKWEQGRNREMNSEEKEELNMNTAFFDETYLLNQTSYRFDLSGDKYVSGNEAHVLTIITPFGKQRTNYYDVSSGLKLKSITTKETDLITTKDLTVEQYFSDYKSYNGVMIPTKITIEQNGEYPIEISLIDVKFNTGLNAQDFKL